MADDVALTVKFDSEEPLVEFPLEALTVSVPLSPVGHRLCRIDGVPDGVPVGVESAGFRDVSEAEPTEVGCLLGHRTWR